MDLYKKSKIISRRVIIDPSREGGLLPSTQESDLGANDPLALFILAGFVAVAVLCCDI